MPKRSKNTRPGDVNQIAAAIVRTSTGDDTDAPVKNAAAVALGRLGGLKGGKARAAKLSKKRRAEIAKKAAMARWTPKHPPKQG